jgi:hypothetical protein
VEPGGENTCAVRQTALFDPVGLMGLAYWFALYPLHALVFRGLLGGIAERARNQRSEQDQAACESGTLRP